LLPVMKSFQAQTVESSNKKRSRVRELEDELAWLVTKANYASYGAIAFQLLGLMFILTRDLIGNKRRVNAPTAPLTACLLWFDGRPRHQRLS
jgi:hypothetical protein